MLGPIDYIVVGFVGNNFDGSVLESLASAVDKDIIRIIDLLFIIKDSEGNVIEGEYEDQSVDIRQMLAGLKYTEYASLPLLSKGDIVKLGKQMPADTAAGVLVIEHLWAKSIKKSLIEAGGFFHAREIDRAVRELATLELEVSLP
jgi:hypothetical protein